ncbi:UvrD-helicase domain-containing protein [uncultured Jatrophihabitans sp.]|uniref:UvrD-helicase domain-containing protein n=1 Tax=uncultured Jatrophihabitans sp. TaxID=1610747 RepID=UPI0035CAE9BE
MTANGTAGAITAVELAGLLGQPKPTDEQAAVIESDLAPAAVVAGAGSGKTETMAARVVWLVANRRVAPDEVLGLTFTRKAAAELGQRVRRRLAQWRRVVEHDRPDDVEHLAQLLATEPTVLTYAAYAGRLVGEQGLRLGAEPDARLLSSAVLWQLSDTVVRQWREPLPEFRAISSLVHWVIAMAGQLADHLADPDAVERWCADALEHFFTLPLGPRVRSEIPTGAGEYIEALRQRKALVPLVREYQRAKAALTAVDFGDQMRLAAGLAQLPQVRAQERARYRAVLLDEYQDTGHAQIVLLRGLFGAGHPVTAVGDPFQSIYGWRGASAGNMGAFDVTFPQADGRPATVHPLATSFRNDRAILRVANAVAAPLRANRVAVPLRPHDGCGAGTVACAFVETADDEAAWVAEHVARAWAALPAGARTAAVLVRRRAQLPALADALRDAGLPVEIVGLGGLLTTPEVVDVVATLRVLGDHKPSAALMRLLTGARWRVGPRDLAVLRDRARWLVRDPDLPPAASSAADADEPEAASLVEALDDLGPAQRYSAAGHARMSRLAGELRRLRRRLGAPLAELVAEVEHTIGVDIEVAARPDRAQVGRVHLDRFLDVAAEFAAEAGDDSLRAFLGYLEAAEDEENGLEAGDSVVAAERVQLLTVHGAKGLEWDVVAVPGLASGIFPGEPKGVNWARARHELPGPLRGDHAGLPQLDVSSATSRKEIADLLKEHDTAVKERHAEEERRLGYVALTRARSTLLASGYAWDTTKDPRTPSPFLADIRDALAAPSEDTASRAVTPEHWFEPEPGAANPCMTEVRSASWPIDPLRSASGADRRAAVERAAALVRDAGSDALPGMPAPLVRSRDPQVAERIAQWRHDVDVLLAERDRLTRGAVVPVELPRQLSVSQLVELHRDPDELARSLRRPLPRPPAPWARRGTAFHTWLEQRWQKQTLLDVDELPGAADEGADDADFVELREAFERSEWAQRVPDEVEVPFETSVGDRVVRGRMDAVFRDGDGWLVVDWKTGRKPTGAAASAAAVQLAAYRLAWARLAGVPDAELRRVRAAFHYVRSGETVEPAALLDAEGLRTLIAGSAQRS